MNAMSVGQVVKIPRCAGLQIKIWSKFDACFCFCYLFFLHLISVHADTATAHRCLPFLKIEVFWVVQVLSRPKKIYRSLKEVEVL